MAKEWRSKAWDTLSATGVENQQELDEKAAFYNTLRDKIYAICFMDIIDDTATSNQKEWLIDYLVSGIVQVYPELLKCLDKKLQESIDQTATYQFILASMFKDFPAILNPTNKNETGILNEVCDILDKKKLI